jgi:hypothetical protein
MFGEKSLFHSHYSASWEKNVIGGKPLKEMAPQVGRFSLDTPIFSVMKVKQLARRKQGQKRFSHNY